MCFKFSLFHDLIALKLVTSVTVKTLVQCFIRLWSEMSLQQNSDKFIFVTIFRTHVCPMKSFVIRRYAKWALSKMYLGDFNANETIGNNEGFETSP